MLIKMVIGALIVVPVLAHLAYAAYVSPLGNYYVTVDELQAHGATGAPVRVAGAVVEGSVQWDQARQTTRFAIRGERTKLTVVYRGVVPETFREQMTVVVEGRRSGNDFQASSIFVKCPHDFLPRVPSS